LIGLITEQIESNEEDEPRVSGTPPQIIDGAEHG